MPFDFINPWMLLGLAGVALPLLAHLISRRKFDVVNWGAMQFLELGRRTQRRVRLEELLLMLLRMGMIGLIAFALSRPWAGGGWFSGLVSTQSRDVVMVIDGSYSMGREDGATTPHATAIQRAQEFLRVLNPGDTVSLIDARDQLRPVISPPTRDLAFVREQLNSLPAPSGTSTPSDACSQSVQLLGRTSNLAREAIVFTDGQALGWSPYDENLWNRFEVLLDQPSVKPKVWIVDVTDDDPEFSESNYSISQLELSRELTVMDFPVRISARLKRNGGSKQAKRKVYLEIDGQRLKEQTQEHTLQPDGEMTVEFEYRFQSAGSHLISVSIDDDVLPGDNRSDAAITVAKALPVLIVDGDPSPDPVKRESFFIRAALSATENDTPWVNAAVTTPGEFNSESLKDQDVVILANVPTITASQAGALRDFVQAGGGLLVAVGDKVDADSWNRQMFVSGNDLLPASLQSIRKDQPDPEDPDDEGVSILDRLLQIPWLEQFRERYDGGLTEARFSRWWQVFPAAETKVPPNISAENDGGPPRPQDGAATVIARFNNRDPVLVTRRYGRGNTMLMTTPLDADWGTLPARPDFVPFLHEMIFVLAGGQSRHNVDVGVPLLHVVDPEFSFREHHFHGPDDTEFEIEKAGDELRPIARLTDTRLPGVYRLVANDQSASEPPIWFVVNFNREESDLTQLADADVATLEESERLTFVNSVDSLKQQMLGNESRTEIWPFLMLIFLGMLVGELLMTRRLVKGGHVQTDIDPSDLEDSDQPSLDRDPKKQREASLV